jgi:cysteinyl-tRNA synthetase
VPTQGRLVKWYTCGPTVYSKGHLGHARYCIFYRRNYIANDMIKRLLRDYFHYDVKVLAMCNAAGDEHHRRRR